MKNRSIVLAAVALLTFAFVNGQNSVISKKPVKRVPLKEVRSDTIANLKTDKKHQIAIPETSVEYSISNYKNVDYLKTNPLQLESSGLHPEIYISNTNRGVIIISSAESNDALKNFGASLELNPASYESLTRQDTILFSPSGSGTLSLDFTKASSISHDYKNAFNYAVDPRTGISWSRGTYKDLKGDSGYGRLLYDLIIVLPKTRK